MQTEQRTKIITWGISGVVAASLGVILALWGADMLSEHLINVIANHVLLIGSALSYQHLSSRAANYEEGTPFRRYLRLLVLFFIPLALFEIMMIADEVLRANDYMTTSEFINSTRPDLIFNIFGVEAWRTRMPMISIVMFALICLSVCFFLYPIETYVKQNKRPWHTISMLFCTLMLGLITVDLLTQSVLLMSLATVGIIFIVLVNFIYVFWVYFSVAIRAPKGPVRTGGLSIGSSLFLIIMVWGLTWVLQLPEAWMNALITYVIATMVLVSALFSAF
jgi:hypothetical protein